MFIQKIFIINHFFNLDKFDIFQTPFNLYYIHVMPTKFVFFTVLVYCIGIYGLSTNLNNLLFSLISMELILLSVSLNFIYFSVLLHDPKGQLIALLLLGIAAAEAAVGLSLLIVSSQTKNRIYTVDFNTLKG